MDRVGWQRQIRLIVGFALAGAAFGVAYVVINFPFRIESILRGSIAGINSS